MKEFNLNYLSELAQECLYDLCIFKVYSGHTRMYASTVSDILQERIVYILQNLAATENKDGAITYFEDLLDHQKNLVNDETYKCTKKGYKAFKHELDTHEFGMAFKQNIVNHLLPTLSAVATLIIYELQLAEILIDMGALNVGVIQYHLEPKILEYKPYSFIYKVISFKNLSGLDATVDFLSYSEPHNNIRIRLTTVDSEKSIPGQKVYVAGEMSFSSDKWPVMFTTLRSGDITHLMHQIKIKEIKADMDRETRKMLAKQR